METLSALLALCVCVCVCVGGGGGGIHQSPVNSPHTDQWCGALMFYFDLRLNKRLSKQSWGWWFETPSRSLWRRCNGYTLWQSPSNFHVMHLVSRPTKQISWHSAPNVMISISWFWGADFLSKVNFWWRLRKIITIYAWYLCYSTSQNILLPLWWQALPGAKRRRPALPASAVYGKS